MVDVSEISATCRSIWPFSSASRARGGWGSQLHQLGRERLAEPHVTAKLIQRDKTAMTKIFIPATCEEDWRKLLAKPDRHWKAGYSAMALAHAWQTKGDFPDVVRAVLDQCGFNELTDLELLVAFPEYKVPLPGGKRASQSDIFALAKGGGKLIAITVEGKVTEGFDRRVEEWLKAREPGSGKPDRLAFLCHTLGLSTDQVAFVRYQLLHRTASAVIKAGDFNAPVALMMVHCFVGQGEDETTQQKRRQQFEDYRAFARLFGIKAEKDHVMSAGQVEGKKLLLAWVEDKL